jgi:hypothetical protein
LKPYPIDKAGLKPYPIDKAGLKPYPIDKAGLKPYPIDKFHTICCGAKNIKQQGRVETLPN